MSHKRIRRELVEKLKVDKLTILPVGNHHLDMTDHVDGLCRFINEKQVLLSEISSNKALEKEIQSILEKSGYEIFRLPSIPMNNKSDPWHPAINFLEYGDRLFVPFLGNKGEGKILEILDRTYTDHEVVPVMAGEVVRDGGALNCVSWEIWE